MNCICGHPEQLHVAGGRCRVPDCSCERFQPGDTVPEPASATHGFPSQPLLSRRAGGTRGIDLTDRPKGAGRAAFQGSADEVGTDVRRTKALGAEWLTFDLPCVDVSGMVRAMERLVREVAPAGA